MNTKFKEFSSQLLSLTLSLSLSLSLSCFLLLKLPAFPNFHNIYILIVELIPNTMWKKINENYVNQEHELVDLVVVDHKIVGGPKM